MSEHLKLRLDLPPGENAQDRSAAEGDVAPIDEAESQMRKALGLLGEGQRHRPDPDRAEPQHRLGDRFSGGLHRRRFVQDGDIPVTVLRRDQGHEPLPHRGAPAATPPTSSRLQRTEAALAGETAAREKAERSLSETQAIVHDLRTKIGHAELAKTEAVEALRREREVIAQVRAEALALEERLQEALAQARAAEQTAASSEDQLADERHARKAAEKALRASESAREAAEALVRALSEEEARVPRRAEVVRRPRAEPEIVASVATRQRIPETPAAEPEPVKWWLNAKPAGKRR